MFDAEGNINSANRSAEALFGYDGAELRAAQSRRSLRAGKPARRVRISRQRQIVRCPPACSITAATRSGRVRSGGIIPLSITIGRTRADGPNFFAVFRDLSQSRKSESELLQARRLTDRAASAKADMLARISHEVRTPLNAIIGFAEVMIGERFGKLGNERYAEYLKDIRASGERVISVINDLHDLSRIETGKLDLSFASQNLNEMVESCVAVMQPQANRERIIIRTSLAHMLPPVVADARALRQIALNLIGNSIHLANAGGQVIVSTALVGFRRGDAAGPRYRPRHERQRGRRSAGAVPHPAAGRSGLRRRGRQPVADQGAGGSQPRAIPHQAGPAFRHADRSGVFPRSGAGIERSFRSSPASPPSAWRCALRRACRTSTA